MAACVVDEFDNVMFERTIHINPLHTFLRGDQFFRRDFLLQLIQGVFELLTFQHVYFICLLYTSRCV